MSFYEIDHLILLSDHPVPSHYRLTIHFWIAFGYESKVPPMIGEFDYETVYRIKNRKHKYKTYRSSRPSITGEYVVL